jgi:pimeloyl-ACP methyl ester carboxylesterase
MSRTQIRLFLLPVFFLLCAMAQQTGPVAIDVTSHGSRVHGRFFPALGTGLKPTLLLVPGFPGNPNGVLDLGNLLPGMGVNVMMFNPRGMWASDGSFSFANTIEDIDAALSWLSTSDVQQRFQIDQARITLGGHSFGGGTATVYAAKHPSVRRLISISGSDPGEMVAGILAGVTDIYSAHKVFPEFVYIGPASSATASPVRVLDFDTALDALKKTGNIYNLRDAAPGVADRSILLTGGWEDTVVTVDQTVLPFYRALKKAKADDVTFLVYHTDHMYGSVSQRLASDIRQWLSR